MPRPLLPFLLLLLTLPAFGQTDHSAMTMPGHGTMSSDMPHAQACADINARMHEGMNVAPTGDPDVDFVRGMIPHHRGAVEMAQFVLENGTDPEVRKLAADVIAAQNAEIEMMQAWLRARGIE